MKSHVVVSIAGLENKLASIKSKDKRRLYCYDLFGMDDLEVGKEIADMKAKGYTVIPSDSCDNVLPDGRCGGHITPLQIHETNPTLIPLEVVDE